MRFCFTFLHKLKSQERHAMLEKDHVKPDGSTMDYEKNLVKIATRGGNVTINSNNNNNDNDNDTNNDYDTN